MPWCARPTRTVAEAATASSMETEVAWEGGLGGDGRGAENGEEAEPKEEAKAWVSQLADWSTGERQGSEAVALGSCIKGANTTCVLALHAR